jgi:hypothetical protein
MPPRKLTVTPSLAKRSADFITHLQASIAYAAQNSGRSTLLERDSFLCRKSGVLRICVALITSALEADLKATIDGCASLDLAARIGSSHC